MPIPAVIPVINRLPPINERSASNCPSAMFRLLIVEITYPVNNATINPIRTRKYGVNVSPLIRSEEHTSELQSRFDLVCRLLLEKKKRSTTTYHHPGRVSRAPTAVRC